MKTSSLLYVYAVLGAPPRGPVGSGLREEPLRVVECGDLFVVVGEMAAAPVLERATLRDHDATIRRLGEAADAVLPVRFGSLVEDASELTDRLEPARSALRARLDLVAGREQMILRIYGERGGRREPAAVRPVADPDSGPGTRYLGERLGAYRGGARCLEIEALRPALAPFVTAERTERHRAHPLMASVYHLVKRGLGREYAAAVHARAGALDGLTITVSGPWPPYAFACEELS